MPHLYFCIDSTCNKTVNYYNAPCCLEHNPLVQGNEETLSHETSECPGCGMDLYVGANGYCSHCWVERFGYDEDDMASPKSFNESHKCSGEWDYDRGIHVCDFADEPECPQHKCTGVFDHEVGQWTCGQTDKHTGVFDHEVGQADKHKCTGVFDHEVGQWTCGQADKHKCTGKFDLDSGLWECVNEKPHTCSDTWTYDYSPRERYPPLPPSPVATDLDDQIDEIEEKLRTASLMTENQTADWEFLWHNAKRKQREQNCQGCRNVRRRTNPETQYV